MLSYVLLYFISVVRKGPKPEPEAKWLGTDITRRVDLLVEALLNPLCAVINGHYWKEASGVNQSPFYVNLSLSDVIKWQNGCYIQATPDCLVMQRCDDVVRDVRLGEPGPQCIAYKPAGDMSQTSWRWWPVCLHPAASPKTSLWSQFLSHYFISATEIQILEVTRDTVSNKSLRWYKDC